jgi:hypothetical protein
MSDDLRETLRESFREANAQAEEVEAVVHQSDVGTDSADEGGTTSATPPDRPEADATSEAKVDGTRPTSRSRDSAGKFAKAEKTATQAPAPQKAAPSVTPVPKTAGEPTQTPVPVTGEPSTAFKAPQSWKPAAREALAKAPPELQQEVMRREREISTALQEAAEKSKRGDALSQVLQPFENHLRRQGEEPTQTVHNMLQFRYAMETGAPQQKAALVANLIRGFGVDIDHLVGALDGQPQQGQGQEQQSHTDPRAIAAQVRQEIMAEFQQQQSQRLTQKAQTALQEWVAKEPEFFHVGPSADGTKPSVRDIMKALLDQHLVRDFQSAYTEACKLHPDVAPYLAQRDAAKAATSQNEATQRARAAASSVKNEPASDRPTQPADSIRGALREAFAEAKRRA